MLLKIGYISVRNHFPVKLVNIPQWAPTMLEAVELPAGIANLAAGLANVDGDTLTLGKERVTTCSYLQRANHVFGLLLEGPFVC